MGSVALNELGHVVQAMLEQRCQNQTKHEARRVASPSGMPRRRKSLVFMSINCISRVRFRAAYGLKKDLVDRVDQAKRRAARLLPR